MQDRVVALTGIHNFRDFGGYAARGGSLRRGWLWRSGQHAGATADDLAAVHALGIGTVVDLRGDSERAAAPCLRHADFAGRVLYEPGETAGDHGLGGFARDAGNVRSAGEARALMVRLNRSLPFRPVLAATLRLMLQSLASHDAPHLLHCLAGKDRTGLAVALVHSLLGVHRDDIMADFLLTNTAGNAEARIAALVEGVRRDFGAEMDEGALRVLVTVSPEFLEAAFDAIAERHGSVEAYAADVLGAGPDTVVAMAERLVA